MYWLLLFNFYTFSTSICNAEEVTTFDFGNDQGDVVFRTKGTILSNIESRRTIITYALPPCHQMSHIHVEVRNPRWKPLVGVDAVSQQIIIEFRYNTDSGSKYKVAVKGVPDKNCTRAGQEQPKGYSDKLVDEDYSLAEDPTISPDDDSDDYVAPTHPSSFAEFSEMANRTDNINWKTSGNPDVEVDQKGLHVNVTHMHLPATVLAPEDDTITVTGAHQTLSASNPVSDTKKLTSTEQLEQAANSPETDSSEPGTDDTVKTINPEKVTDEVVEK